MDRSSRSAPSGSSVLAGFAATLIVFAVTHWLPVPGTLHDVMRTNGGHEILDLQPAFSAEGVYQRLSSFGEAGREAYFRMLVSMDILFPLMFAAFLGLLARYAISRTGPQRSLRFLMLMLPFGYLIPDLAENLSIAWLIHDYPQRHDGLASALGYITAVKRICMSAAILLPLMSLFLELRSRRRRSQ